MPREALSHTLSIDYLLSLTTAMYVDSVRDNVVMFNYLVNYRYGQGNKLPILLKGLDQDKQYRLKEIDPASESKSPVNSEKPIQVIA